MTKPSIPSSAGHCDTSNSAGTNSRVSARLDRLALLHGIDPLRPSPDGVPVPVTDESKRRLLLSLGVDVARGEDQTDPDVTRDEAATRNESTSLCFLPDFLSVDLSSHERVWGISLQLYELRSERNWGIGDFEDLKTMIDMVASLGGDFIGLNPLHAPFLADASRCSPYEPSNRQFLNPLYIAVDRLPGFRSDDNLKDALARLRHTDLVDYQGVAAAKLGALRGLWMGWRDRGDGPADAAFGQFLLEQGDGLRKHALFEALSAEMVRRGFGAGWHGWPQEYRDPQGDDVEAFAEDFAEDIRFHAWLQYSAHRQLTEVADYARAAGLRIGLYLDLAVGEALDGSATWSEPDVYLTEATVGSPPDPFAPEGQDWHLAGFQPARIASGDDPPFQRMVETAMRYAGAIRIDHAAALRRLFLVPVGAKPAEGAYVSYPQQDLLDILARTSTSHRCLVIGEDLGLLPDGLQDDLAAARILSYRILSYERDDASFKPASTYPTLALACISTHDHQTLAGWWRGADIAARAEHGIVSAELTEQHEAERQLERGYLAMAIESSVGATDEQLTISAHRFIAETPSLLAAVRLADLTDEQRPTNIPGTSDSYPNWRPKLSVPIDDIAALWLVGTVARAMRAGRERPLQRAGTAMPEAIAAPDSFSCQNRRSAQSHLATDGDAGNVFPGRLKAEICNRPLAAIGLAAVLGYLIAARR